MDRIRLMLKIPRPNETDAERLARRALQRAYKKAVRVHVEHTNLEAARDLADTEAALEAATEKGGATQTELIAFRDRIEHLHNYQGGLFSTHPRRFASIADAGEPEPYYAQMSAEDKIAFWQARWTEDVFVSFL
jgi:hypothetical protein